MTREELKRHCLKQIAYCEEMTRLGSGYVMLPSNHRKSYEEHKLILELLEQEQRWIPVSERLPEPNRLVLCYITTGATETYFLALWNDTINAWEEGIGGYRLLKNDLGYEVIAWMPLPKPYREVEE